MSKISKFNELYKKSREDRRTFSQFTEDCRKAFGVSRNENGELVKDNSQQVLDPKSVSFQEVAYTMLGPSYGDVLQSRQDMFREVTGGEVLPSAFQNINGFDAVTFGLLDALILEGYQNPKWLWQDWVKVEQTRTNGGKSVRAYNDDQTGYDLAIGEEAPSVGLKQGWVARVNNVRKAHKVLVSLEALLYDWTDTIQQSAMESGEKIANQIEIQVAKTVLGIDNNYVRDGTSGNTYLTAKGTSPMNYKNGEVNALTNYQSIQTALATLSANTNPYTGIPIGISVANSRVLVPISKLYDARAILHATSVYFGTDLTAAFTAGQTANPLEADYRIDASSVWDKVLSDNSVTTFSFLLAEPQRAFAYRQLVPFNTVQLMLGPKEVASNVALGVYCQEIGAPYVTEPRYTYKATTA